MKQISFPLFALCMLAACNTATTTAGNAKDTTAAAASNTSVTYAYTPAYSADFSIGDPKYAQTVLDIWKDYDNNTLDNHKDAFADSIAFDLSDGSTIKGPRDTVMNSIKAYRNSFPTSVSAVEVVVSLKPKDKDETWVCVWGKEVDTRKDNKMDSVYLNENWMFNKDGKIAYVSQFKAQVPKK